MFFVQVHLWLGGVFSIDTVCGCVNESVCIFFFFFPTEPPFDEG